jgi:hypothetical protein
MKGRKRPAKTRNGGDVMVIAGAIISWNARFGYWTVRRGGKIIGERMVRLDDAMTVARETAKG